MERTSHGGLSYASLGERASALTIDAFVAGFVELFLLMPLGRHFGQPPNIALKAGAVPVVLTIAILWSTTGSPGMSALSLRLVDSRSFSRPAGWRSLTRAIPTVWTGAAGLWLGVLILPLGVPDANPGHAWWVLFQSSLAAFGVALVPYVTAVLRADRRSLWDILSGTLVLRSSTVPVARP